MSTRKVRIEGQRSEVSVLFSQFCISIGGDQIELIYDHSHQVFSVFVESELVIHTPFSPRRESFNYVNLIDIAAKYREVYHKKKQQDQELRG